MFREGQAHGAREAKLAAAALGAGASRDQAAAWINGAIEERSELSHHVHVEDTPRYCELKPNPPRADGRRLRCRCFERHITFRGKSGALRPIEARAEGRTPSPQI
jgi:hypothetical protein